jgi:mitochondrial import inner membrane translocase subunit TIM44
MIKPGRISATRQIRHGLSAAPIASLRPVHYGGSTVYRRLIAYDRSRHQLTSSPSISSQVSFPHSLSLPQSHPLSAIRVLSLNRSLHTSTPNFQRFRPAEDVKDPPREDRSSEAKSEGASKEKSEDGANRKDSEDGSSESSEESKEKKDMPPPPPHGDKTPWQVFTETLRSEFKASKEWNEGTKQLASSAHQFTESEGVRRARAAYDATAGAATTKTAEALRTTGRALGQGAAWTWDTKVVQGIREGVNATGRGIEKATRPVRETQAFQNIKEAVDDGSSTRYGGWIEKEERRKKRELRDLKENGRRPVAKMEEDPKYVATVLVSAIV